MKVDFFNNQDGKQKKLYIDLLSVVASLSNLYADSEIPFIYYRAMENIFCKAFNADNLSRSDFSADAGKDSIGIGLKTFLQNNGKTFQKVAEFNKESYLLKDLNNNDKIKKVAKMRNERILSTQRICNLDRMIYHLLTRSKGQMSIYEEPMDLIDIDNIRATKVKDTTIHFTDNKNEYSFNNSKSTLLKRFNTQSKNKILEFEVEILDDPYELLLNLDRGIKNKSKILSDNIKKNPYIILPLYSPVSKKVEERSGLNQWNARGRKRDCNEVYIPVPSWIHQKFNGFFNYSSKDNKTDPFNVILPNGEVLSMRLAQQGGKGLMSNPNSELGKWILRDILQIKEGSIVTKEMLDMIGIDSVRLSKHTVDLYRLDFLKVGSYEDFKKEYK